MGKDKRRRFEENLTFANLVQPAFGEVFRTDHRHKGRWREDFFRRDAPIVLELGCGRGEYTVELGRRYPDKCFIGIDVKGARLWRGAKTAAETGMGNVGFLRTRIEFLDSLFGPDEIDEIWITFPDPQPGRARAKKRLTSPFFLGIYAGFLKPDAPIHLKTDSAMLHEYTKALLDANGIVPQQCCPDIYGSGAADEILSVKTTYERRFLAEGKPITYLRFCPGERRSFIAPEFGPDKETAESR